MALFGVCVTALTGQKKKKLLLSTLVLAAALVLVGVAATNKWTKNISGRLVDAPAFHRVINKGNPANDPRFEYWTQALKMIKERPVLGSGPGSFYFGSRRLQSQPSSYSWFAHSFALQILAEQGVVGALPALFLFGWVLWHIARFVPHHPPEHDPLSRLGIGVLLTAVYSFIEFNLSFAVVWALFWAITGLILGAEKTHNDHKAKDGRQLAPALLLLTAFYVVFIGQSAIFVLFPKRADVVFYLTPFDAITAQYYLASDVVSPRGIITATAFHKADTETLQGVAEAWAKLGFINESINVRRRILSLDPLIEENHNEYLDGLVQMGRFNEVSAWFDRYPGYFFPAYLGRHVVSVPSLYIQEFPQEHRKLFESKYSHEVRYSRFYYNVGLWYLSTEPEKTRALWELSSLLQPKLSYLWLERASLEQQVFGDRSAADNLFLGCLNNPSAAAHCKETRDLQQVFPPGHYKAAINEK